MAYSDEQSQRPSPPPSGSLPRGQPDASMDARSSLESDRDRKTARFLILAILFFVTGFLGLPVLWLSKSFSLTEKIVWSVLNTIYTCALIAGTVAICIWALRPFFSALL